MNIVLLQSKLTEDEIGKLINEFPQYIFLAPSEFSYKNLGQEEWSRIEVIYGNRLTAEELEKAHHLRWIHSPAPNLNPLCINEIAKKGNIIVTSTREENSYQIAEFVMAGILAFAKQLFQWEDADLNPAVLLDSKWRETMWTLKDRLLLQIGLGSVGTEVARMAKAMGMKVWGAKQNPSFHPHCKKVFPDDELHSILPTADVVCIALPRGKQKEFIFRKREFELMKEDSVLIVIGSKNLIDEADLVEVAGNGGKFRGILLDAYHQMPVPPGSKLWSVPNMIITPEVAPRPKSLEKESYHLFRFNLRQYLHGNFADMRNVVGSKQTMIT